MVFYMLTCFIILEPLILYGKFLQNLSTMNMFKLFFLSHIVSTIFASGPPREKGLEH